MSMLDGFLNSPLDIADEAESLEKLHELHAQTVQGIDAMKGI